MIDIKRILVGTDFSARALLALRYGAEFAKVFQAELLLCHILEPTDFIATLPPVGESYIPANLPQMQEQQAKTQCEKLIADLQIPNARIILVHGTPFAELVRTARTENADLLILGTHGRGAIAHLLLGSVAERVVRAAPCPVLTVREGEHDFVLP
jgi:nucleotide-binding universal stress UspA family protein